MKIGVMGLSHSGKTTVFNVLTGLNIKPTEHMKEKYFLGSVFVNDERIDFLSKHYNPKKTTYPEIQFIDYNIRSQEGKCLSPEYVAKLRECDAILKVIRAFENDIYPPATGVLSPEKELEEMDDEIILNDILTIEKRLEKLNKAKHKLSNAEKIESTILEKFLSILNNGEFLYKHEMTPPMIIIAKNYGLLTFKYEIVIISSDSVEYKIGSELKSKLKTQKGDYAIISALEELELSELDEESKLEFASEMNINEFAKEKVVKQFYYGLNLITFLTTGEDEVKGWTIKKGTIAQKAAGKIHSDIERGFIKAQVVSFEDFESAGSMKECSKQHFMRLEGKEYIVKDGDLIEFKFNV